MVKYENYKMRVVEIHYKKIDLDTEEITEVVRYAVATKFSWLFDWRLHFTMHIGYTNNYKDKIDVNDDTYGFYKLEDCIEYMKESMTEWKNDREADDRKESREKREKRLKRKYRKELKTTYKIVMERNMLNYNE